MCQWTQLRVHEEMGGKERSPWKNACVRQAIVACHVRCDDNLQARVSRNLLHHYSLTASVALNYISRLLKLLVVS